MRRTVGFGSARTGNQARNPALHEKALRSRAAELLRQRQEFEWAYGEDAEQRMEALAGELRRLTDGPGSVMVVGLGNAAVTPDALGPLAASRLFLTRHLIEHLPEQFGSCRSVCAVCPGVLATTGIESAELVRGAVAHTKPSCVIVIDALATGAAERLCRTVQLTDTGIVPGSGVGNRRSGFSQKTLGVPVLALGAATVTDAAALCPDADGQMIVTPRDIDEQVRYLASVLAAAINLALHPELSYEELAQFVPNCS